MFRIKKVLKKLIGACYLMFFTITKYKKIKSAEIIFFLPYYHTGGAERVHLNILKVLKGQKCCVIFTELSATKKFYNEFRKYSDIIELNSIRNKKSNFINNLLFKLIYKTINKSKSIQVVFSCNTNYFYQILPKLNTNLIKIDLFHAFSKNDNREIDVVNSVDFIDKRVVINRNTKNDLLKIYDKFKINKVFLDRIYTIQNGIEIIEQPLIVRNINKIKIGFMGRWSEEKRPEIFIEIAKLIKDKNECIDFVMAGTGMKSNLNKIENAGISFLGEIRDDNELIKIYKELAFIVITSEYEGFPMVIMEAMAQGVIPISTNVGGINEHISNNVNGILISDGDYNQIIKDFVNAIELLIANKEQMDLLSKNAYNYAYGNFKIERFNENYQNLFEV